MTGIRRRDFLATGALTAGALAFGPTFWREAFAADPARPGPGPYGPLGAADANGIRLPAGFSAREIARSGQVVPGTTYPWHIFPDGQATYALSDGGWVLVSNSESVAAAGAGSSAIRFGPDGKITNAYRILAGTNANCAGGRTPWGTWLSCEEFDGGQVWEADPLGQRLALNRPALGVFKHEAAAVDPLGERIYLTEDAGDGCFYRFTPTLYPDLSSGRLEVLVGATGGGRVTWKEVPDPSAITGGPTRSQVPNAAKFAGGEGIWFDSGVVYFSAKGANAIYEYDTDAETIDVLFDGKANPDAQLSGVDNITVSRSGDLFVCEDNGQEEFSIGIVTRERQTAHFLTVGGPDHAGSELAGAIFDPSGKRMYFASQRGFTTGVVYEVTGPFRTDPPKGARPTTIGDPRSLPAGQGPSQGGGGQAIEVEEDVDGPGLKISAGKRVALSTLVRRGITVNVSVQRPGTATLALRSDALAKVAGDRGSTDRPKLVTIASAKRDFPRAGRYKVVLKPSPKMARRLKKRGPFRARITVQAKTRNNKIAVSNRAVRVLTSSALEGASSSHDRTIDN